MFTGISEELGEVRQAQADGLTIGASRILTGIELGDSIAVNGVCLTVTAFDKNSFSVGVMPQTLRQTNLGALKVNDKVNLERAAVLGGKMGGHLVQGHIDDVGRVSQLNPEGAALLITFEAPDDILRYVVDKGFIAVDGVSLTVASREARSFMVSVVGYTRENTTLGRKNPGDLVNLEVDIIAKYVEQVSRAHRPGITTDFLKEHGFS